MASRLPHQVLTTRNVSTMIQKNRLLVAANFMMHPYERSKAFGRPISPHLQIYRPQIPWILSGFSRTSSFALTLGMYGGALAYLQSGLDVSSLLSSIHSIESIPLAFPATKFLISFPTSFHFFNGIRHVLWDMGYMLDNRSVTKTGWIAVFSSLACAIVLSAR